MNWPFFSSNKSKTPWTNFAKVSEWIESFGRGDDTVLEPLLACSWNQDNGATATVYQLAQTAWAKRVGVLMERTQRDLQFATSEQGLVLALGSLRATMPPLLRFASWDAFSGEPRRILENNLRQTLQKFLEDLDLHLQRQPLASQALLAEAKSLLTALPQLVGTTSWPTRTIPAETPSDCASPKKRNLLFPV